VKTCAEGVRLCSVCHTTKPLGCFYRNPYGPGGLDKRCMDCMKAYLKHRRLTDPSVMVRARASNKRRSTEPFFRLMEILKSSACVDCGERDPLVLDFDHVRGVKRFDVSASGGKCFAWATVEKEMAKCEIRCANCHRRRTAQVEGWRRLCVAGDTGTRPTQPVGKGPFNSDRNAFEAFTWIA
jgi:hypothetical protein